VKRLPAPLYDASSYDPAFLTAEGFARALEGDPCDVVDIHYMWTPDYTRSARKLRKGTPIVFTVHNSFARGEGAEGRAAYLSDSVLKFFLRNCDLAVCASDFIRRDLRGKGIPLSKLRVVPNGLTPTSDEELARLRAAPRLVKEPYAVFVGRIERTKGLDLLVEAARDLKAPLTFVLVGQGPELESLKAQAHAFKVDLRFAFEGYVGEARKRQLLAQAEFFAYPATFEPTGLAVLEALDLGCPVLSTSVGGIPEVAGEAARLLPPGDADGLGRALNELVEDASLRKSLSRAGRTRAERFSWPKVAKDWEAALGEVARP
jgi:glycosyltransferase involved in cell wall biosynthesis